VTQSFLDVARELIDSPEAKTTFADDPQAFLAAHGLVDLSAAELQEAIGYVAEALPAPVARQLAEPPPPTAPEPAALAKLAATTTVEEAIREAEPGTVDFTAVLDPAGAADLPPQVQVTTVDATAATEAGPEEERAASEAGEGLDPAAPLPGLDPVETALEETEPESDAASLDEIGDESDGEPGNGLENRTDDLLSDPFVDELPLPLDDPIEGSSSDTAAPAGPVDTPPDDLPLDDLA
jgi:hypothetical protein